MANERPSLIARLVAWWQLPTHPIVVAIALHAAATKIGNEWLADGLAIEHCGRRVKLPLCHDGPSY